MIKTRTMFVKGYNWFEQFSTIADFFYQFVGKKVKITVEEIDEKDKHKIPDRAVFTMWFSAKKKPSTQS